MESLSWGVVRAGVNRFGLSLRAVPMGMALHGDESSHGDGLSRDEGSHRPGKVKARFVALSSADM
jgi:hypothetical protein